MHPCYGNTITRTLQNIFLASCRNLTPVSRHLTSLTPASGRLQSVFRLYTHFV